MAPPRQLEDVGRMIGEATGLETAVEFRVIGPEGEPIDDSDPTDRFLTLTEAMRRAVMTDPGLQAAIARVRMAQADSDQARLLPNPVLDVVVRWGAGKPQIEASLAQDFVRVLQIPRRARAADNTLRRVAADAVTAALDVTSEVAERYAGAQAFDALVPLLKDRLALFERLADTASDRLEAGEGTRVELTTLKAQRVALEVEIDAASLAQRGERLRLARLIGQPLSPSTWALEPWVSPEIGREPEARWVEVALAHRPEVQAVRWRLAALEDEYALTHSVPWEGRGVGVEAERDDDSVVGPSVSVPLPIFDTGRARRSRVTAEQLEARHDLTLTKRKVVEEVRIAYETLATSRAILDRIRLQLLPVQQERHRVTEDVYKVERDITPLILAEQALRQARAQAIEVERQAAVALVRLQRAVGGSGVAARLTASAPEIAPRSTAASN